MRSALKHRGVSRMNEQREQMLSKESHSWRENNGSYMETKKEDDSIVACNHRMLEQQLVCDVKFKVGQSQATIGAHKYILSARSDVFFTMFHGSVPQDEEIIVPDVEMGPFKNFLRYLYCDEVLLDSDCVLHILYCCKKYNVQSLLKRCVQFVEQMMSVDNVCSLLEQAHFFDEQKLYQSCLTFIRQQGEQVLQTSQIQQLSRRCIEDVISSDDLLFRENIVFETVVRWAESECKRQKKAPVDVKLREVLGDLLYKIRFVQLGMQYYSSKVSTRNILSESEKLLIFQLLSGVQLDTGPFSCKPRRQHRHDDIMLYGGNFNNGGKVKGGAGDCGFYIQQF